VYRGYGGKEMQKPLTCLFGRQAMQTADLVLAIAVPLVALCAGWVGVEMSLTPPDRLTGKTRFFYRAAFIGLMLAAIGLDIWQTARNAQQQERANTEFQQTQGQLSNKVSEQGGKLDAISHFEQQFLSFVSQQRPTNPDDSTKAYEAMALTVMKMAQGSSSGSSTGEATRLRILYENSELDGRTIENLSPPNLKVIQLAEIKIKNTGPHEARDVSARLYFSKQVMEQGFWEFTASDESNFISAFHFGGMGLLIHPQETWNLPVFSSQIISNWEPNDVIMCKLKIFYGSESPVIINFSIRQKK
jgi:hypothetical protein